MLHTDQAQFFGEDLIVLKSPMSGILFIQVVKSSHENTSVKPCNYEFRPIKTIKMCQGLYKDILKSDFEIFEMENQIYVLCGSDVDNKQALLVSDLNSQDNRVEELCAQEQAAKNQMEFVSVCNLDKTNEVMVVYGGRI